MKKELLYTKQICEAIDGIKIIEYKYYLEEDVKDISDLLSEKSNHKYYLIETIYTDSKMYQLFPKLINKLKIDETIILSIGYGWMCKVKVINWKSAIISLLKSVGVCFYSYNVHKGILVKIDEDNYNIYNRQILTFDYCR